MGGGYFHPQEHITPHATTTRHADTAKQERPWQSKVEIKTPKRTKISVVDIAVTVLIVASPYEMYSRVIFLWVE